MSPTIHTFLIHEVQEARNKDLKNFRENYSRKILRVKSNEDIFKSFLTAPYPVISNMWKLKEKTPNNLRLLILDLNVDDKVDVSYSDSDS